MKKFRDWFKYLQIKIIFFLYCANKSNLLGLAHKDKEKVYKSIILQLTNPYNLERWQKNTLSGDAPLSLLMEIYDSIEKIRTGENINVKEYHFKVV